MGVALGEYELLKRLGAGGMGEVFLARPTKRESRDDDRFIVIKTLLPHLADDEQTLTMFLDEARLAARLNHGNVAQIYELGEAGGTWFIAMEYVSGRDCAKLLRSASERGERFSPEVACRIVSDAAAGLNYSHDLTDGDGNHLGLVHRDVSPANIVVTFEGQVKLIDFGVAKAAGRVHQTQAGQLKGKISYMSPEQAKGMALDKRSDIFSLGIVLHELLTGRKLFDADGQMEVLWAVCEAKVEPPSQADPGLPEELDEVVMKALTLEAADRYASAQEFRNALERWIITSGRNATPGDVGAMVSLLCSEDTRMERESGPLWDAEIKVGEITSIVDPEEIAVQESARSTDPFAPPPPGQGGEPAGSSTSLSSNKGFDPPEPTSTEGFGLSGRPRPADPGDSIMDAATVGMEAYKRPPPPPFSLPEKPTQDDESEDDDVVNTSITHNPLDDQRHTKPRPTVPPPPPPAAYPSGVEGDDDDVEVELPETALNTPTSILTGDSDDDYDADGEAPTLGPRGLPSTRPDLPLRAPRAGQTAVGPPVPAPVLGKPASKLPLLVGLAAVAILLVAGGMGLALFATGDDKPAPTTVSGMPQNSPLPAAPKPRVALTVVTDPPGANATLDGRPIGKTPILSLPLPPTDQAVLELTRRGHAARTETLILTKDLDVTYKLAALSVIVTVTSRPQGATVSAGGEQLGVTPFEWPAPSGDTVQLKFAKKGYRAVEQELTVQADADVSAVLKKSRGGGRKRAGRDRFRPSSSVDPDNPPKRRPEIPTFGD